MTPVNVTAPSFSGTMSTGQTLVAATGSWTGDPTSYAYQWLRCDSNGQNCSAIGGATSSAYVVQGADVALGVTVRLRVYASNAAGTSAAAFSAPSSAGTSSASPTPPAAPTAPINNVINASGLGLNVTTTQTLTDYYIDGTGDSAILFQLSGNGSSMTRCKIRRAAVFNSVGYGKHGVYGSQRNLTLQDMDVQCSSYCASGLSMRFDGAIVRRFLVSGAPHALTYYDSAPVDYSDILFEDGTASFTGDTGVWIDAQTDYRATCKQDFVFRRIAMTGSGAFLKVSAAAATSTFLIDTCTLNGAPVTAANCPGVPNLTII